LPLARLIAASALAREESRGAHQRSDHPDTDPALDEMHATVRSDGRPHFERWD
jgi:L-aspartate oxidase